jgi:hypothetical protein
MFGSWHDDNFAICTSRMSIIAINTPTRGFPRRFALHTLSFNFLDDRTIGCKNDETRVHAPVMRMPLLVATTPRTRRSWPIGDGDGSDGCARRWTQILARDRNLSNACLMVPGDAARGKLMRRVLQHARIEPDSRFSRLSRVTSRELRKRCV